REAATRSRARRGDNQGPAGEHLAQRRGCLRDRRPCRGIRAPSAVRVVVVGPAKTGNVWVQRILAHVYGLEVVQPPFHGVASLAEYAAADQFADDSTFIAHVAPRRSFFEALAGLDCQFVTVIRNPYDTFVSHYHFVPRLDAEAGDVM